MRFLGVLLLVSLSGCGLLYDFDPADDAAVPGRIDAARADAGVRPIDASNPFDASGCAQGNGERCSPDDAPYRICVDGLCIPSVCGDLFIDMNLGEICELDDPSCVDCGLEACECPDVEVPCREPVCSGADECLFVPLLNGEACLTANSAGGECVDGVCRLRTCGNTAVEAGEQCDDGNGMSNDGCENDCTFTCTSGADCDDFNPCNGAETCRVDADPAMRFCEASLLPPTIPACEVCVEDRGVHLPDFDGDGFALDVGQPCPPALIDCDDDDPLINPAAAEICDGIDNDCDASTPDSVPLTCGPDEDGDGWPRVGEVIDVGCGSTCPVGSAPGRTLLGTPTFDCDDNATSVHPTQTAFFTEARTCTVGTPGCAHAFDYNCDGVGEREETRVERCALLDYPCSGGAGWVGSAPACGGDGRFANCRFALVCLPAAMNQTQGCR